jgi:hypothetical protein
VDAMMSHPPTHIRPFETGGAGWVAGPARRACGMYCCGQCEFERVRVWLCAFRCTFVTRLGEVERWRREP